MQLCMGIFSVAYVHVVNQTRQGNLVPKEIISVPKCGHVVLSRRKKNINCVSAYSIMRLNYLTYAQCKPVPLLGPQECASGLRHASCLL